MPTRFPRIRQWVIAQFSFTALTALGVMLWFLNHEFAELRHSESLGRVNLTSSTLLRVGISASLERTLTTIALARPADIGTTHQAALRRHRLNGDADYRALLAQLQAIGGDFAGGVLKDQVGDVMQTHVAIERARPEVDRVLAGRPGALGADGWDRIATDHGDALGRLQALLCAFPREPPSITAGCLLLKDDLFWTAEFAGRARALLAQAIAEARPLTRLEHNLIFRYHAGVGRRIGRLRQTLLRFPDDTALREAVMAVQSTFHFSLQPVFRQLLAAAVEGTAYPFNAVTYYDLTAAATESLAGLITNASRVIDEQIDSYSEARLRHVYLLASLLTAFVGIAAGIATIIRRRLLLRLGELHAALAMIGGGDLQRPVRVAGDDELSELGAEFEAMRLRLLDDIVRREQAEEALRRQAARLHDSNEELRRANAELQQFTTVASHDLKAPLRAVYGLSTLIDESLGDALPEDARRHMQLLRDRVRHMDALINGMLDYSRAGAKRGEPESFSLAAMVDELVRAQGVPEGFTITVAPDTPTIVADRAQLQQVLANLIGNAIGHHDMAEGRVQVSAETGPDGYRFEVADDGPGVPPAYTGRVFEMFQRGPEERGGTGIGLAVVKKVVEGIGGSVVLESGPGRGTRVRFTWPPRPAEG